jgi:hypothetical protein
MPPEVAARITQLTREQALTRRELEETGEIPQFEQCPHLVAVGYTDPDAYPEQQGLAPGPGPLPGLLPGVHLGPLTGAEPRTG